MARGNYIFVLIVMLSHMLILFADGRMVETMKDKELLMHEGTIKTIQTKDGDIIDCVDINKQPAFNHPLLKNHTIQMKPEVLSRETETDDNDNMLFQSWHEDGECPEGTIPIARSHNHNFPRRRYSAVMPREQLNQSLTTTFEAPPGHEYAVASTADGTYYGGGATINLWNPSTEMEEFSLAQIWLSSGSGNGLNTLEAGWKATSGEKVSRFFIYWTSDGYQKTGCHNLLCPGFVQTNRKIVIGNPIRPVSTYAGEQFDLTITIQKYKKDGNWWLLAQNQLIGYWPRSILTTLADHATDVTWGGEITNKKSEGHHTTTDMGSGHFPTEGFGKASYFARLGYIDASGAVRDPEKLITYASNPSCYNINIPKNRDNGVRFYFGGPGFSPNCQ